MDKKILIIDDDESITWVIKKALEPLGYKIITRTRLASGLRAVDDHPHVVLLDLILPDGNGLAGLREIRATDPDITVIMITANAQMESTITAMKEGAYDYLEKPFDIEELKIVMEKAFRDLALRQELHKFGTVGITMNRNEFSQGIKLIIANKCFKIPCVDYNI